MANLLDTIAANRRNLVRDPSGVLTQQSPTGIQQLATNAKLLAMPTDPLSALVIGANPHQAKMMGTPAQTAAALTYTPDISTVQTEQRRTQPRQSQGNAKVNALQEASNIPRRVNEYIQAEMQKLATAKIQKQVATEADIKKLPMVAQLPYNVDYISLKRNLEMLAENPSNAQLLSNVNTLLGRNGNSILTPEEMDQLYKSSTESIASGAQGLVDRDLTVGDLLRQENFPYDEINLSNLLELSPEATRNLSIGQLKNRIAELGTSAAQVAAEKSISPLVGQAERQGYQDLSRELEETGIATAEHQMRIIEDSIASGELVDFAGQPTQIEDLLGDEGISQTISTYLNSAPDSEFRRNLEVTEPNLVSFIKQNEQLLGELSTDLTETQKKLQAIQTQKEKLREIGNIQLSDEVTAALLPQDITATAIDPSKIPFFSLISKLVPEDGEKLASRLNTIIGARPDLASQLQGMSETDLSKLLDQATFSKFLQANDIYRRVSTLSVDDLDGILREYFQTDPTEVRGNIEEDNQRRNLGLARSGISDTLDIDHDGEIDQNAQDYMYGQLREQARKPDLNDIGGGTLPEFLHSSLPKQPSASSLESLIETRLGNYAADGDLSRADILNSGMTVDEMLAIQESKLGSPTLKEGIGNIISDVQNENSRVIIDQHQISDVLRRVPAVWGNPDLIDKSGNLDPTKAANMKVTFSNNLKKLEDLKEAVDQQSASFPKSHLNDLRIAEYLGTIQGYIDRYQYQLSQLAKRVEDDRKFRESQMNKKIIPNVNKLNIPTIE